jgi:hypothetical protein
LKHEPARAHAFFLCGAKETGLCFCAHPLWSGHAPFILSARSGRRGRVVAGGISGEWPRHQGVAALS